MQVLIVTEDKVFARMMHLEFFALGITTKTVAEMPREKEKAELFLVDAAVLLRDKISPPEGDAVLIGYPEELSAISARELTRYYVVVRPFCVSDFLNALFIRDEETAGVHLRPPKVDHPADSLALDEDSRTAYYKGEKIELTQREFALLSLLVQRKGESVSRAEILSAVFEDSGEATNVVDVYVNYLRRKIDSRFGVRLISTVRGHGYTIRS